MEHNEQLKKETETLVSVITDYCIKNGMDVFICIGKKDTDIGYSSFVGAPGNVIPILCAGATENLGMYLTVTTSSELLESTRQEGFDFRAVHEGRSTAGEQFKKINENKSQKNGTKK